MAIVEEATAGKQRARVAPQAAGPAAYLLSAAEVLQLFRVRDGEGLQPQAVAARRERDGVNEIPKRGVRWSLLPLERLTDVMVIFLIVAAGLSLALGEVADAVIIGIVLLFDLGLSAVQVWRTERTLERLREHVQQMAMVLRGGQLQQVPARELVVGDIIEVRAGQKVPADARVLVARGLRVAEAALTGESSDIEKTAARLQSRTPMADRRNMLYMGTTAVAGQGRAVVTAVGTRTEFGKIAQVLKGERAPQTPLRRKLQRLGYLIGGLIVVLVAGLMAINVALGDGFWDSARLAVTLIVSAIPEDLTVILTIALTVGVVRILKRKGVVRELSSGETLGAATVICTDKTGTLTLGEMTAERFDFLQGTQLAPGEPVRERWQQLALQGMALASDAHRVSREARAYVGSATERTSLAFVESFGLLGAELRQQWRQRDSLAFDSKWKYRASLVDHPTNRQRVLFVVGAPEVLLEASAKALNRQWQAVGLTSARRRHLAQAIEEASADGQRLLGVAVRRHLDQETMTRDDVRELVFLGVLLIRDPIRQDVIPAIRATQSAGVSVRVVTGDHAATARAVARGVGLTVPAEGVITGQQLADMSDEELQSVIDDIVVFARVSPIDKRRIVRALRARGAVVAMTGDGVNDAVALKVADIGVAMGSGKDIAKDAADLVLLDDNFATIVAAVREGRVVRDNVRKVVSFLLATNAAEVALFITSLLFGMPLPLLAAQVLWINLVTDGTSDIALSLEPAEDDVMKRAPEAPQAQLLPRWLWLQIAFAGAVLTVFAMGLYWYVMQVMGGELTYARTMVFTLLATASLLSTWSWRSLSKSIVTRGFWQNPWLFASAGFSLLLHLLAIYSPGLQGFFHTVPLSARDWAIILGLAVAAVIVIDLRKVVLRKPNSSLTAQSHLYGLRAKPHTLRPSSPAAGLGRS